MMTQNSILENYFRDYAQYHRTKGNQRTHLLGIPMIVIAVLSWLSRVWIIRPEEWMTAGVPLSLIRWDLGIAALIIVSAWYTILNWRLGASFFLVLFGMYWIGRTLPNLLVWIFFVGGWILQLVGHYVYEKKSPAFLKNITQLLIGPIWIFAKLVGFNPNLDDSDAVSGNVSKK
jgi:uncharacterized membrane protein YGL010W